MDENEILKSESDVITETDSQKTETAEVNAGSATLKINKNAKPKTSEKPKKVPPKKKVPAKAKKPEEPHERIVATEAHPIIDACTHELFRLETDEQAIKRLENIAHNFIIAKKQLEEDQFSVSLWIKGYSVSKEEKEQGYLGNFATLRYRKTGAKLTIYAEKDEVELKLHPQKKREKQKHPNWGHPLLRQIKKELKYTEPEEPQELFMRLHEQFPETSIPCTNKLYLMVYSKKEGEKIPKIVKFVFTIEVDKKDGGGYKIIYRENNYSPKPTFTPKKPVGGGAPAPTKTMGKFTSMVNLKKKKK
jgi:hypothetical protein